MSPCIPAPPKPAGGPSAWNQEVRPNCFANLARLGRWVGGTSPVPPSGPSALFEPVHAGSLGGGTSPPAIYVVVHGWAPGYGDAVTKAGGDLLWWSPNAAVSGHWAAEWAWQPVASSTLPVSGSGLLQLISRFDPNATVVAYSWLDDSATSGTWDDWDLLKAYQSESHTYTNGIRLAAALAQAITGTFWATGGQLRLIGHSHGSKVVTVAAMLLQKRGFPVAHLTICDSPESDSTLFDNAANMLGFYLQQMTLASGPGTPGTFVDSYVSCFGVRYAGAALAPVVQVGLDPSKLYSITDPGDRHTYAAAWYAGAAAGAAAAGLPKLGFSWPPAPANRTPALVQTWPGGTSQRSQWALQAGASGHPSFSYSTAPLDITTNQKVGPVTGDLNTRLVMGPPASDDGMLYKGTYYGTLGQKELLYGAALTLHWAFPQPGDYLVVCAGDKTVLVIDGASAPPGSQIPVAITASNFYSTTLSIFFLPAKGNRTGVVTLSAGRRVIVSSVRAALAAVPHAALEAVPSPPGIDPALLKTHKALFETYLPLAEVPAGIRPLIEARAVPVSAGMLAAITQSPAVLMLLELLTDPTELPAPLAAYLTGLGDAAVTQFLAGGYSSLAPEQRDRLWDAFIAGPAGAPGPHPAPLTQIAATVRLVYLSGIWDLPIGGPLAGIQNPKIFTDNLDVWVAAHQPDLPPTPVLAYNPETGVVAPADGRPIDYLVIGSGPGGATVASRLQAAGARVVVLEKGPFVIWGSMDTRSYPALMYRGDAATTTDGSILIRSGQTAGGGTTVNIDLAFSPLAPTVQSKIQSWIAGGLLDPDRYSLEAIARAYTWVRDTIVTREVSESELNRDNQVLWDGARAFGVDPSLYHLNRFPVGDSPSAVDDKRDAARQLLLPAMQDPHNPLSVIPDADAVEILFDGAPAPKATGVRFVATAPWTAYGNTLVDPCRLNLPAGVEVTIEATNIILGAGTIGSSRLLLQTARKNPGVLDASDASPIGRGLVLHPSVPLIGLFDEEIKLLEGLDSATFVDAFGPTEGIIYETMSGLPAYGAVMIPGSAVQVYGLLTKFQRSAGFGLMRVDASSPDNRLVLNDTGDDVDIVYALTPEDRDAMRHGLAVGIRMMFLAGAKTVIIPSNENVLGLADFRPTQATYLTDIAQADAVEANIQFIPNRTLLTSAHLQATNKMGPSPERAVVSTNQRVWSAAGAEIPNLYVMDSSIFPTSVGANPMQSIYSFAKIFADRLAGGS